MVEELAQQHRKLEEAAAVAANQQQHQHQHHQGGGGGVSKSKNKGRMTSSAVQGSVQSDEDDETVYYDAVESSEQTGDFMVDVPISSHRRTSSGISVDSQKSEGGRQSDSSSDIEESNQGASQTVRCIRSKSKTDPNEGPTRSTGEIMKAGYISSNTERRVRRKRLPEQKPNYPLNLWSIMKNCIGKDLTKIPMPVNFSEPLSMLQRLTEDFEYSDILDRAAQCSDSCEQLSYVAAFTVSSYATTSVSIISSDVDLAINSSFSYRLTRTSIN